MRKLFVGATLIISGTLGAGAAHAGDSGLQWSIVIGTPVYTQPVPVHVRPLPVYQPPPPAYARTAYLRPTRWDRDGDGVPNRRDRLYNPAWDRDGDGIPNRHDRQPDRGRPGR
jgi:hypothetical protein